LSTFSLTGNRACAFFGTASSNHAFKSTKRVNVSAAFFLSIEFQETGYLVYRMYKTDCGDTRGDGFEPAQVPSQG
jgi:hypothetical protein